MKEATYIPGVALALLLSGCVLSGKQQPKVSAAPPPPKSPATAPASASSAPQAPLSIPQTVVELPPPQPLSQEAILTTRPPEQPADTQPGPRVPARSRGPVAGPPRVAESPPPAVPAQATPAPPLPEQVVERPPIAEILSDAEVKRLKDSIETRKREIKRVLDQTDPKKLNPAQRDLEARVRTLVQQSDDAGMHNDWRQADALAGQALTLVRELQGGR